ncbi:hypothetical protein IGI80_001863 [Enterococcus sp. DIV1420a]
MFMTLSDRLKQLGFVTMSKGGYQLYLLELPP